MINQIDKINAYLQPYHVQLAFTKEAFADLLRYDRHQRNRIMSMIVKRVIGNPRIKPHGIGEPLRNRLKGFTKIKAKRMGLRIIYRPVDVGDNVRMEVIAIGPRDKDKVYRLATERLTQLDN